VRHRRACGKTARAVAPCPDVAAEQNGDACRGVKGESAVATAVLPKEEERSAGPAAPFRAAGHGDDERLSLEHMSKRFEAADALVDCSFAVPRGKMLGFLGPNGAGKTTTMRAVFGLLRLDAGEVLWHGRPVQFEDRLRFGYMPEERGLYPRMSVGEQLEYFGRLHGLDSHEARAAARKWLGRLGLADRATSKVEELSHGNQQRAQLAAALVHEPELLVLDEPFAGLDPIAVRTLAEVLRGEATRGAAVVFSSHQLDLVEDICEEVVIIDHGRIVATGTVDGLRRQSRRRWIELRLEDAPPQWLPAVSGVELVERVDGELRLRADRGVDPLEVLASAEIAGRVIAFGYGPPTLGQVFMELVAP
jgi:ABC-2 type transport system ATP-binding protein